MSPKKALLLFISWAVILLCLVFLAMHTASGQTPPVPFATIGSGTVCTASFDVPNKQVVVACSPGPATAPVEMARFNPHLMDSDISAARVVDQGGTGMMFYVRTQGQLSYQVGTPTAMTPQGNVVIPF